MRRKTPETLSAEELDDLAQLTADWRGLLDRSRRYTARLHQARTERELVESRLLCVLHDFLAPAVQDLEAIAAAAGATQEGASR